MATAKACTKDEAQKSEVIASKLSSWAEIHDAYLNYAHCDDGAIGEGFTQSVVHLLASNWTSMATLQRFTKKDAKFEEFVVKHIDASADPEELKVVANLAKKRCSASANVLCRKIEKAAQKQ